MLGVSSFLLALYLLEKLLVRSHWRMKQVVLGL